MSIFTWIAALIGITSFGYLPSLLISIVSLYFHFQLLTNIAAIAKSYDCPQEKSILRLRTIRTIMNTLFALPLPWSEQNVLTIIMLLFSLIIIFITCTTLFSLHRTLQENISEEEL